MAEIIKLYSSTSALIDDKDTALNRNKLSIAELKEGYGDLLLVGGFSLPDEYKYRQIIKIVAYIYAKTNPTTESTSSAELHFKALTVDFDEATVTYDYLQKNYGNEWAAYTPSHYYLEPTSNYTYLAFEGFGWGGTTTDETIRKALQHGFLIVNFKDWLTASIYTAHGANKPYIDVEVGSAECALEIRATSPTSNETAKKPLNRTQDATFSVQTALSFTNVYAFPNLENIKFRYRPAGDSSYQELNLGTATEAVIAGNLLSANGVEYQFEIKDNLGHIETSAWISCATMYKALESISPTAGSFVNRSKDSLFSAVPYAGVSINKFRYRKHGVSSYTELGVSGNKCILPADSIADGGIYEYQFGGVDKYGVAWESSWVEFATVDATASSQIVSPSGGLADVDNPVAFVWLHSTTTGSPQTKADLQISADGAEWAALATVEGAETMYLMPAKSLAAGTWYWRVRTYNLDGIAGDWSAAAQFLAIGSPTTPLLSIVDASPRPTIAWQATDQEAWELTIDSVAETNYGTGKRWTSPKYLADGQHTVSVRVQNKYGRWSNLGSLIVAINNIPGEALALSVESGDIARLTWSDVGYDFYLVYRDGLAIAKTEAAAYNDRLSAGVCTYQVRGCYADSYNYGLSNLVEVDIIPEVPVLVDVKSGDILRLPLSEQQHRTWTWSRSISANSYHVAGRALPSVDVGEYIDESLSGQVAFDEAEDIRKFNRMIGRLVCLKTDSADMAIGVLTALSKSTGLFYSTYQIAVASADFEEEISLDS